MKIASNVAASIQQAQARDKNNINTNQGKNIDNNQQGFDKTIDASNKKDNDKVAQIKEDIKNGKYQINLKATADKMAQSLLNV